MAELDDILKKYSTTPAAPEPEGNSATGIMQTIGSSLREIPEGLAKAGTNLVDWERNKAADIAEYFGADPETVAKIRKFTLDLQAAYNGGDWQIPYEGGPGTGPEDVLPTDQDIENRSNAIVGGPAAIADKVIGTQGQNGEPGSIEQGIQDWTQHVPETPLEEDVSALTQFAPALLTKNPQGLSGGRAALTKLMTRVLPPALATHTAGDAAHEYAPDSENAVRFLVGILGQPQAWKSGAARAAVHDVSSTPGAMDKLRQLVMQDYGDSPASLQRATQALQELGIAEGATLMDIGGNMKQAGQQIFAKGGEGRTAIETKLKGREDLADVRGDQLIRENVGAQVDEGLLMDALTKRKQAGAQAQRDAHPAQTAPVDLAPIVTKIDTLMATEKSPKIRSALTKVRTMLHISKTDPKQPEITETASEPVLSARQAIGEMLYEADGSPKAGLGPKTKQVLDDLYADINRQLDPANPTLRAADAEIAQAGKETTAFKGGKEEVINNDSKTAKAPDQFAREWDTLSAGERTSMRQGLTARIDAIRGLTANDRTALKKIIVGDGKWNHQKIATIIGEEGANNLVRGLEREQTFQQTERDVMYGSKTAATQTFDDVPAGIDMAKKAVERTAAGGVVAGAGGAVAGGITAPITAGLNKLGDWAVGKNRAELGRLLSSGRPQDITAAIERMQGGSGAAGNMLLGILAARQAQQQQGQ